MGIKRIKWTQSQLKSLETAVRAYNKKISSEARKYPDKADYLPHKMSQRTLKKSISTAAELKRTIAKANRIFKPDALKLETTRAGAITTKYTLHEVALDIRRINFSRKKLLAEMPIKPSEYTGTIGIIEVEGFGPRENNVQKILPNRFNIYVSHVESQVAETYSSKRDDNFKKNYLRTLQEQYNSMSDSLYDKLVNLDSHRFTLLTYSSPFTTIDFSYSHDVDAEDEAVARLELEWDKLLAL